LTSLIEAPANVQTSQGPKQGSWNLITGIPLMEIEYVHTRRKDDIQLEFMGERQD